MSGDLVPFGKHKGQPVEVLLADHGYREWVLAQPWVKDRYPTFHQTIINVGGEPAETPEHNEFQASFLEDGRCLALARLLFPGEMFDGTGAVKHSGRADRERAAAFRDHVTARLTSPAVRGRRFEADGWDVVFTVDFPAVQLDLRSLPACLCVCDHDGDCPQTATCHHGGDGRCRHEGHDRRPVPTFEQWRAASEDQRRQWGHDGYHHCDHGCPWRDGDTVRWLLRDEERRHVVFGEAVRVECKPDLGDDYPAVLRQVTRYPVQQGDVRCVVVRRYEFTSVTRDQVSAIFKASGIRLIDENWLLDHEAAAT